MLPAVLLSAILILTSTLAWFKFKGTGSTSLRFYIVLIRGKLIFALLNSTLSSHEKKRFEILEAGKKQERGKHETLVLGNLNTLEHSGEENPTEGFEFSVASFRDIAAVTNNFHESFMIGQGGFGKVYKVTHPHIFHA